MKFKITAIAVGCIALLSGCGGGGGGGSDGGKLQAISFDFPGGQNVGIDKVATVALKATASGGGPVTFASTTPSICTVDGTTLSLLAGGECRVTATQAGGNGYAATTVAQLFVIPKNPQFITFRNPGSQPLDSTPVAISATSSVAGHPVTFSSSTPNVCTVSGNSVSKLANGMCTIVATQAGDATYATTTMTRNIPIGTAVADPLTFLSGYQNIDNTKEQGAVQRYAGSTADNWWCATDWCGGSVTPDGSSFSWYYNMQPADPNGLGGYMGFKLLAPTLRDLVKTANTQVGLRIDAQAALKFNLAMNQEWFSTGNGINVDLYLGHFAMKGTDACNVKLHAFIKPTTAAATDYSLGLKDKFTISETCGLTGLDLWTELQDYPISQIEISAGGPNTTVSSTGNAKPTFPTKITMTGPVIFQ